MSAVLKSLLISCAVLSMAALSFADEPARSVLDGGRPMPPAMDDASAAVASCDSCAGGCAADTCCEDDCRHGWCLKGCGLFKCHKDSCNTTCSNDCCDSCQKQHGCWLHQGGKHCGHGGCQNCGDECGSGCDNCGCGKHGHLHGKHGHCGSDCYGHGHYCSRCNMIPHIAYINPLSSYYYFRPYQAFHVRAQQDEVVTYGGDPRNPYANLLFDNLYAELEAAWAEEEAGRLGSPFEDEVEDQVERPAPPAVDPPAPGSNTSHAPASPLRAVQKAKPLNPTVGKPVNTAAVPSSARRVFRVNK